MPVYWTFLGVGFGVWIVVVVLFGTLRATRRIKARSSDPHRLKRQLRRAWLTVTWAMLLPLTLLTLVLTGYGVAAVWVLIAYVFLGVVFLVFAQAVLVPRARRRVGR